MRNKSIFFLAVLLVLAAAPLAAQQMPTVTRSYLVKPKAGMDEQFEQSFKTHLDWHRKQKDTWTYNTYQFESGERFGQYVVVTGGHKWEDFDAREAMAAADAADVRVTIAPHIESTQSLFSTELPEVSRPLPGNTPTPLILVLYFYLKPGAGRDFNYCIRKFHEAIGKTNWPTNYFWLEREAGASTPSYVLVLPQKNWAAMNPMAKSFVQMLEEAYGRQEAQELLEKFSKTIREESAQILRHRPDLSYQAPAAAGR